MNTSLKLQLDVKNNAQELQKCMLDLNNWEEEMKRKEMTLMNQKPTENTIPPLRNKIKRSKPENENKQCAKPKKISAYDYSAWDKFDVEKALAEIDKESNNNDKSEETEFNESSQNEAEDKVGDSEFKDSSKFSLVDEAFYEKEMGNQFVKKEQWSDAIKCYTNAINLDTNNAIYYANRSLCFLKLKNFKAAETDATTAIQLDKNYIKAYQRRAYARQALCQLTDAKSDYEKILKLEPNNAFAGIELKKINDKLNKEQNIREAIGKKTDFSFNPKNIFKNENIKSKITQSVDFSKEEPSGYKTTEFSKNESLVSKQKAKTPLKNTTELKSLNNCINMNEKNGGSFEKIGSDKIDSVQPTEVKSVVFKPLPEWCKIIQPISIPPHKRSKKPLKRIDIMITDKDEDLNSPVEIKNGHLNINERKEEKIICKKDEEEEKLKIVKLSLDIPKTAIQFYNCWKILRKSPEDCYSYLKIIPVNELPQIFENSLESDFFSQIVTFLASDEIEKEPELIYNFLWGLSKVKRFSSLILFMTEADRSCVRKAVSKMEKVKSVEEISELLRLYELKA